MKYLEGVSLIEKIEKEYTVMDIKYNGQSLWPFLRIYMLDAIALNKQIKLNKKVFVAVIKALFTYNIFALFKKYKLWIFTCVERRKTLGEKRIQRVCGVFSELYNNQSLFIEKPAQSSPIAKRKEINEKNIISESLFFVITNIIYRLNTYPKKKITGSETIDKILKDNNINFNYQQKIRQFVSQYKSMRFVLHITHLPKAVFIECPYSSLGYVLALKEKNIPVIELQHGVLNEHHDAYNNLYYDPNLYPDGICVYGQREYDYLTKQQLNYCKNVYMSGYYFLDKANNYFTEDIFAKFRTKYKSVVLLAGQPPETNLLSFCKQIAEKYTEILFVYIPRNEYTESALPGNIVIKNGVNIYQYLKWCDIHMTISSTTALESQFFSKPSIFYNFNNMAKTYYSDILNEENGCFYVYKKEEFDNAINQIKDKNFQYKQLFADNCKEKIRNVVEKYL